MPRVICLGEILVDRLAPANTPDAWQDYGGGAPANVAMNLAKLGVPVAMVGCVGGDQQGAFLRQVLQGCGVDITGVATIPLAETRQVYVQHDQGGDRTFVKTTGNADLYLSPHHLPVKLFAEAEYLVLGTLALANPQPSRTIGRALKLAEDHFVKVIVDLNWRELFWAQPHQAPALVGLLIKHADFVKMTATESTLFFRTATPAAIVQQFSHLEGAVITDGAKGCRYHLGGRQSLCPALTVNTIDTTGAGDAFLAGFIAQLCQHNLADLDNPAVAHHIIQVASAAGAIATTTLGAIHPHLSWQSVNQLVKHFSAP